MVRNVTKSGKELSQITIKKEQFPMIYEILGQIGGKYDERRIKSECEASAEEKSASEDA